MMKIKLNALLASALLIVGLTTVSTSFAETAIIVHPSNNSNSSPTLMKRIFLGKAKAFEDGSSAAPAELAEGDPIRSDFNDRFLGKTDAQLKSYWGRLVFTGKASAPLKVESAEDMVKAVAKDPSLIGYIDASKVTDEVKAVHFF